MKMPYASRLVCWWAPLLLVLASMPALANPALWVVKSPTATIYLFGTIHVLPVGVSWHYPALDAALAASGELYVEEDDGSPAAMRSLIRHRGFVPPYTNPLHEGSYPALIYVAGTYRLSSQLNRTDREHLMRAAARVGLPRAGTTLEKMRPWLAAIILSNQAARKAGYEPRYAVDAALRREFIADGKRVAAFGTAAEQLDVIASMPYPLQLRLLHNVLDDDVAGPARLDALVHAWESDDVAGIAAAVNGTLHDHYPLLYQSLVVDRNRKWARQIAALLRRHETAFVAVGAGHLAGPDSVQVQLAKLGIRTERVH